MAVMHTPDSGYAKESIKWEALPTLMGPGLRPYVKRAYPAMLYRAEHPPEGGPARIVETLVAESDQDEANKCSRGFARSPQEAFDELVAAERDIATLAAERAANERRMSPKAQAEAATADAEADGHLASMPITPIKRRGRPVKIAKEA